MKLYVLLFVFTPLLLIRVGSDSLSKFPAVTADLVPWKTEKRIHTLERLAPGLWDEEPDPSKARSADDSTEVEETVGLHLQQHCGDRLGVAELVHEMETHDQRRAERTESDRVDFGIDQVLE